MAADLEGRSTRSVLHYQPTGSKATIAGQEFEMGLCCLLLVRCQRLCQDFFLACNHGDAGLYDDVVLVYRRLDSPLYKAMLVQMKHKEKREIKLWTKSTRPKAASSTKPASELADYCRSYALVRDKWRCLAEDVEEASDGRLPPVQEATYVFFTNSRVQMDGAGREMAPPHNGVKDHVDLWDLLMVGGTAFRIDGDNLDVSTVWGAAVPDIAAEFLDDLVLCCDQADHKEMAKHLDLELRRTLGSTFVASQLWDAVKDWWEQKGTVSYLTKDCALWEAVVHAQRARLNSLTPDDTSLMFSNDSKIELVSLLRSAGEIVHLKLKDDTQMTMARMRIRHAVQTALILDWAVLKRHMDEVKAVWKTPFCNVVAVTFSGLIEEALKELLAVVQSVTGKCLVVASSLHVGIDNNEWLWTPAWSHLHHDSRERLLRTPVVLQGTPLSLADVVSPDPVTASDVLSDHHVHGILVHGSVIVLGNVVPKALPYYVTRNLQRESTTDFDFFDSLREREVIIGVTGVGVRELEKLFGDAFVTSSVEDLWARDNLSSATLVTSRWECSVTDVRDLCFKFGCDGFFINASNAMTFISRESKSFQMTEVLSNVLHSRQKKVMVYGDPGVGKSSLVTRVCQEAKRDFPRCWVLRVDMGKHGDFVNTRDFDVSLDAEELLLIQVEPGLQRDLLKHALKETGDIFVFVDAFDEISPTYTLKCCRFLRIVATHFRYRKLLVTTRPVTKTEVETALDVDAYHLPEFSKEEQRTFLRGFYLWKERSVTDAELEALLETVGPVLQVPLLCYMASEVTLASGPGGVDVQSRAVLYEEFLERQIRIYLLDKYGLRSSVAHVEELLETCKRGLRAQLTALAVTTMLTPEERKAVVFADGGDPPPSDTKLGLVVGGRFVHRTFAEFFLGVWLGEHYRTCSSDTLENILFRDNTELVSESFNRFLYRGCRLHVAVARADLVTVRTLLAQDRTAASVVDAGGRTALHVTALSGRGDVELWTTLLDSEIEVDQKDDVFGWTAARCAERMDNWAMVEFLVTLGLCDVLDLGAVKDISTARQVLRTSAGQGYVQVTLQILAQHPTLPHEILDEWPESLVLHQAATSGCERLVAEILRHYDDVDILTGTGYTALYLASLEGHTGVVALLVNAGASLTKGLKSALSAAAHADKVDVIDLLIDSGADVDFRDKAGKTALHIAALEAGVATTAALLKHGADADARDKHGTSPLHCASLSATPGKASLLLDHGADVDALDSMESTPLYKAAAQGGVEVVELLLSRGAQVNRGENPLGAACVSDRPDVVALLVDAGADTEMALYYSGRNQNPSVVAMLLERGIDANTRGELGQTGLHMASSMGRLETISLLLDHGAAVNLADVNGMTPLHWAAQEGRPGAAELLLKAGAKVDIRDKGGSTALHMAASTARLHIVETLLDHDAAIDAKDASGRTALHWATKEGTTVIAALLLDRGASIDAEDDAGKTALQIAIEEGRQGTVALLLERGATPRGTDSQRS